MRICPSMGLLLVAFTATAQEAHPLDSRTAKTEYSVAVRPGRPPLKIRVEIGATGKIGDALVFKEGSSTPFQRLASCEP